MSAWRNICTHLYVHHEVHMRKLLLTKIFLLSFFVQSFQLNHTIAYAPKHYSEVAGSCYEEFSWSPQKPSLRSFELAYKGYLKLEAEGRLANNRYLTIIDFSLSSNEKRLWTLDMHEQKVLFHERVSHGRNTGDEFARYFSNQHESHKSSLGFYSTGEIYMGKHDESLRLIGLERGFNDNALARGIVIHAAEYATEDFIHRYNRLGRSFGCPAVRPEINEQLVSTIAGGSCLFIYFPDNHYLKKSNLLNS